MEDSIPFRPGPLARSLLFELAGLIDRDDVAGIDAWVQKISVKQRRRESQTLEALVTMAAGIRLQNGVEFYQLTVDDAATETSRMVGRLVTATLNRDQTTVDALVASCLLWPPEARADILAELARDAAVALKHG